MTATRERTEPDAIDSFLVVLFLVGIYLEYALYLSPTIPIPAAPAGLAGLTLLLRRREWIEERQLFALVGIIALYLLSTLCASGSIYLPERLKGFLQLSYSLVIGYGVFICLVRYERRRLARLFLGFSVLIVVGCVLENYTGFRAISDAVRSKLFQQNLYESGVRDEVLYGGVRPKFFTSEPSYVAYALTFYAFAWYVLSTWRWKTFGYLALLGIGMFLVRSPTLLLGGVLIAPYEIALAGRSFFGRMVAADVKLTRIIALSILLLVVVGVGGVRFFNARVSQVRSADDPSFFFREIGPALVAKDVAKQRPVAGAGLTGEEAIASRIIQVYVYSPSASPEWDLGKVNQIMNNFFWLHWIYLGIGWGLLMFGALTRFLRTLHASSVLFCWTVWAVMGQASGAYVSPKPWATLLIACAISVLHYRQPDLVPYRSRLRIDAELAMAGAGNAGRREPRFAR